MSRAVEAFMPARGSSPDLDNTRREVLDAFERVQSRFGQQIPLKSGYRGASRNKNAGGAKRSQHLSGNAIDVDVSKLSVEDRKRLIRIAETTSSAI